eukprot:gnl/MRDRNA2_/MRDRNA2_108860_c0_seq1.p1 gnl/MRDRNA2_/MRDRNA2_108860_c0~~gnl/MRDRNA2_/MRDRNA2_108860_c0_seq1.p1  ORF type:complete len:355 (-),score=34.59 gnl/MRDRNA2_/MRDRNA2_108860_c0_seq1:50-1114(-)
MDLRSLVGLKLPALAPETVPTCALRALWLISNNPWECTPKLSPDQMKLFGFHPPDSKCLEPADTLIEEFESRIQALRGSVGGQQRPGTPQVLVMPARIDMPRRGLEPLPGMKRYAQQSQSSASYSSGSRPGSSSGRPHTPSSSGQMVPTPCFTKPGVYQGTLVRSRSNGALVQQNQAPGRSDYPQVALLPVSRKMSRSQVRQAEQGQQIKHSQQIQKTPPLTRPHSSPGLSHVSHTEESQNEGAHDSADKCCWRSLSSSTRQKNVPSSPQPKPAKKLHSLGLQGVSIKTPQQQKVASRELRLQPTKAPHFVETNVARNKIDDGNKTFYEEHNEKSLIEDDSPSEPKRFSQKGLD